MSGKGWVAAAHGIRKEWKDGWKVQRSEIQTNDGLGIDCYLQDTSRLPFIPLSDRVAWQGVILPPVVVS